MALFEPATEFELVDCEVCLKEIPASEANSEEASDYVVYFCGLECYAKWKAQPTENNDSK